MSPPTMPQMFMGLRGAQPRILAPRHVHKRKYNFSSNLVGGGSSDAKASPSLVPQVCRPVSYMSLQFKIPTMYCCFWNLSCLCASLLTRHFWLFYFPLFLWHSLWCLFFHFFIKTPSVERFDIEGRSLPSNSLYLSGFREKVLSGD